MDRSTKILILGSLLGILGIATIAKTISTNQTPPTVVIMPQHHNTQMLLTNKHNKKPE